VAENSQQKIRNKVVELARQLGNDATRLGDDDVIPATGLLDSASIMALILWYEDSFDVTTDDEELILDNFGTINLMADYLSRHQRR
jgi:D-alanine--poly(phosphoribitol) ligase subunit 2